MTTYNGEKYIRAQLDSILAQDYPNVSILIRDDGSSDRTIDILKEYSSRFDNISFYTGENLGVVKGNFDLIKNSDSTADYYAFSDQDDYWKSTKISRAVLKLRELNKDKPLLYCGKTILTDKNLNILDVKIKTPEIRPSFNNAIVENICVGCTAVINHTMIKLVQEHIPEYTIMHDWWLYLTASCFGHVYYDMEAFILYRQHESNVMGARTNYWDEFRIRLRNFRGNRGKIRRQLAEFESLFKEYITDVGILRDILNSHNKLWYRCKLIISKDVFRQRRVDDIVFKLLILAGRI